MAFNDDDLKRFVCNDDRLATMKEVALREEDYLGLALLTRLEAAEVLIETFLGDNGALGDMSDDELMITWRRAAGKE